MLQLFGVWLAANDEPGIGKYGIGKLGIVKHWIGECGIGEHGIGEHGIGEYGIGEYGIGEHGIGEHGIGECGIGEYGIGEMLRHQLRHTGKAEMNDILEESMTSIANVFECEFALSPISNVITTT